ncbi:MULTISPECIES: adenosylmethionine decarboxylase [Flavobacteriaceae]|uniref:adenosylmethionine decarboxylase n=1 Tax=Flavobacteriaceae TaxID=49546 RepID=UPI0010A7E0C1|nr:MULTISPECIES: adenosylmethionine decarboxylase [Flavobacteriaceae]QCE42661.1 adenosylmethionine decarboxylase [Psychroserpens sp. NJDZ02]QXP59108.1 adenosylmethionine decarboxylase [Olleya sp. HaHaR_3_96]
MQKSLGYQTTVDYYNCNRDTINSVASITRILEEAAKLMKLNIVNTTIHQFSPIGISGVIVIKESHIAIHTWPEHNYVALDFFTCSTFNDLEDGILWIKEQFESDKVEQQFSQRGFLNKMK